MHLCVQILEMLNKGQTQGEFPNGKVLEVLHNEWVKQLDHSQLQIQELVQI